MGWVSVIVIAMAITLFWAAARDSAARRGRWYVRAIRLVAPATLMAILAAIVAAQEPEQLVIDQGQTTITLHVGRAGVFGFAGHDHEIVAPAVQGQVTLNRPTVSRSTVSATFDAAALKVTGVTRPLDVPVTVQLTADGLRASGKTTVQQSQFGLRPVTAGVGTVRVKDEVEVMFSVTAKRR
jgi:polyisoprenoid-binding protein YceI